MILSDSNSWHHLDRADRLLIIGGSTRAPAFSVLRAGLEPWCVDPFSDQDLRCRCPSLRLPAHRFPQALLALAHPHARSPFMYTGRLEKHPEVIGRLAAVRPLWGSNEESLRLARDPEFVSQVLARESLPHLLVHMRGQTGPTAPQVWMLKPLDRSRGSMRGPIYGPTEPPRGSYLQEFADGISCSAIFVAGEKQCTLLGGTRQLVGERWLHAPSHSYCGSIGPLLLEEHVSLQLQRIGQSLAAACGMRGLFGLDFVLRDGVPWVVEINPRYTASIEILEYALDLRALDFHRRVFKPEGPVAPPFSSSPQRLVGKAILFARDELDFPMDGPWQATLHAAVSIATRPDYADIPSSGERIVPGKPILTFFVSGANVDSCLSEMRARAVDLDHWLWGR